MSQYLVITTCTKKKLATPVAYLPPSTKFNTQEDLLTKWREMLDNCPAKRKIPAEQLYRGRGFQRVLRSVASPDNIMILSAGLGLVKATDTLVPYNLTTSSGSPNHVKNHVEGAFDEKLWWNMLNEGKMPLHQVIADAKGKVLIALSRSYMSMIADDLKLVSEEDRAKIRLFGSELEEEAPFELFPNIMPYDNRLNLSNSAYSGSKIDFSARALHHFTQKVLAVNPEGSIEEHSKEVFQFINQLGSIDQANKETTDDVEIRRIVDDEWDACFGRFTRILQTIRKKYGFACSEQRLKRIIAEKTTDEAPEAEIDE